MIIFLLCTLKMIKKWIFSDKEALSVCKVVTKWAFLGENYLKMAVLDAHRPKEDSSITLYYKFSNYLETPSVTMRTQLMHVFIVPPGVPISRVRRPSETVTCADFSRKTLECTDACPYPRRADGWRRISWGDTHRQLERGSSAGSRVGSDRAQHPASRAAHADREAPRYRH